MDRELAVERYAFRCPHCEAGWTVDYDVQHVIDGSERVWGYYSVNGLPACAPTAHGAVSCPSCGAEHLDVRLAAIRAVPLTRSAERDLSPHPVAAARQLRRKRESTVERYAFSCPHCDDRWTVDYDVQHVIDGSERVWGYYSVNGLPACAPTAPGTVCCRSCGAEHLYVTLVALRTIPGVADIDEHPFPHPVTAADHARRSDAPLLPAHDDRAADAAGTSPAPAGGASHRHRPVGGPAAGRKAAAQEAPVVLSMRGSYLEHSRQAAAGRPTGPAAPEHDSAAAGGTRQEPAGGDPHRRSPSSPRQVDGDHAPVVLSMRGSYLEHSRQAARTHRVDRATAPLLPGDAPLSDAACSGDDAAATRPQGGAEGGAEEAVATTGRVPGTHGLLRRPHLPWRHRRGDTGGHEPNDAAT